jgi:thiol-disulfide isomerase/thioredoxin
VDQIYLLGLLLVLATAFGVYRRWSDGRTRVDSHVSKLNASDLGAELGEKVTLLQFSSAFCAPCRTTKQILGKVENLVPGVAHIEVDAEANLELVRRLDINRTPTTLILDQTGAVRNRVVGVPKQDDLLKAIAESL